MNNPVKNLTKKEWLIWAGSLQLVIASYIFSGNTDKLTLISACIGITSLIFAAKGNVWAQILMIVFSIMYAIISCRFHYWGEMITYLGMALPMAVWSTFTWLKNPAKNGKEVAIRKISLKHTAALAFSAIIVTAFFYFILRAFDTPNIFLSTFSVTTSFIAASLTMLRSSYYALAYAANDLVLIVLWILASAEGPAYIPVAVKIAMEIIDFYDFVC